VVWAVSLSTLNLCTQGLTTGRRIRRCSGLGNGFIHPLLPKRPLPQRLVLLKLRRTTKIVFVENQLSPGSVSFSLLPTTHPMLLQQQRVRSPTFGFFGGPTHRRRLRRFSAQPFSGVGWMRRRGDPAGTAAAYRPPSSDGPAKAIHEICFFWAAKLRISPNRWR